MNGKGLREYNLAIARARGVHTSEQWKAMVRVYHGRCLRCGKRPLPYVRLTKDHVWPVCKGGSDDITNLQPLCSDCNSKKGDGIIDYRIGRPETPAEYLPEWTAKYKTPTWHKIEV